MNGRDSQEGWVDYQQRARQPIGPEGFERRRGLVRQVHGLGPSSPVGVGRTLGGKVGAAPLRLLGGGGA